VNWPALFIMLAFLFVSGTVGLWFVRKTTGRSIREMLALLAGAIVFILLMAPSILIFDGWLNASDKTTRHIMTQLLTLAYLPVAVLVWWTFNKLAKSRRPRRRK
jgi:NADH:ubiquinone oxidoreductase subunit 6 (subunit J)